MNILHTSIQIHFPSKTSASCIHPVKRPVDASGTVSLNLVIAGRLVVSMLLDQSARASENFWGCLAQSPPKNLGQIMAALAISGIFERFSPGPNGPEVGGPVRLFKVI